MSNPRFSFVATSRNDDHGGDVLRRTQSFISRLAEQCERHKVSAELILVEWNPPPSRASLEEVLAWPRGSEWFSARVMTVSRQVHLAHRHGDRLALFQMIGKNVGIRRALGEYIIATNIDIIFSDELFEWFRKADFRADVLYRSDRWDIPNEIQLEPDLDVLLLRAREEAIRRNLKEGTYVRRDGTFVNLNSSINPRWSWNRFDQCFYHPVKQRVAALQELLTQGDAWPREQGLRAIALLSEELPQLRRNFLVPLLHTNACGDFTMLSRRDWFRLRGYPEWHIFSWTIDSMLLVQAHCNGIEIHELDEDRVHYHIEHDNGSGWTPEGADRLWARLEERRVPYMSYDQYVTLVHELQDNSNRNVFTIYNGPNWGLATAAVEDRLVVAENSAARPRSKMNTAPLDEDFCTELTRVDLPLQLGQSLQALGGTNVVFVAGEDGGQEVCVQTTAEPWSHAVEVDLKTVGRSGEYWFVFELAVESGAIGIGLLGSPGGAVTRERLVTAVVPGWQALKLFLTDDETASALVFRNGTEKGGIGRFRLRNPYILFADWDADEEFPLFGPRPVASDLPDWVQSGAPILERHILRAGHKEAVVRALGLSDGDAEPGSTDEQFLVFTPAEYGAAGAWLDLPPKAGPARLSIDLHVIGGTAGVGFQSRFTDQIIGERHASENLPVTRLDLDIEDARQVCALVVRNLSPTGPAKLLIHRIEYR